MDNPEFQQWDNLDRAIQEVQDLVFDDGFVRKLYERSIQIRTSFAQGEFALCLPNDSLYRESALSSSAEGTYLTISDMALVIESKGDYHFFQGEVKIDGHELLLSSHKGKIYLQQGDMPPLPLEPAEVTNFLLITAAQMIDQRPDAEAILHNDSMHLDKNSWERLHATVGQMGNLTGISKRKVRSLFVKDTEEEGIITELIESETPHESDIHTQFRLHRAGDLLSDETNLNHKENFHTENDTLVHRVACRAIALTDLAGFITSATESNPFPQQKGAIYGSYIEGSSAEEVRRYALLCRDLLESYRQLTEE